MLNQFREVNPPPLVNISLNLHVAGSVAKLYAESEIREDK
jgi:hypothetical protein